MIPYKKDAESKSDILFAVMPFHSLFYTYTASLHGSVPQSGYLPAACVHHYRQRQIHHHCMFLTPASTVPIQSVARNASCCLSSGELMAV